ncbi:hypothetical protein [Streptomyces mirabilis]
MPPAPSRVLGLHLVRRHVERMQQLGEHVTGVKHAVRPKVVEVDRQHTIG